jgi:trans-aconitate methyltransferase
MATEPLGKHKLSFVDVLGHRLSRRPILDVVRRYDTPRVLDVGCGHHARVLRELSPKIRRGVGVDRSVADEAKRTPNLEMLEGEIDDVLAQLAPASFDVVLVISVLEHVWQPVELLARCHALLDAHGTLAVNVPTWTGKVALETAAFRLGVSDFASIDDHKTYYAKKDLWPLLVRAGFRPSRIRMRYHKLGFNLFAVAEKG